MTKIAVCSINLGAAGQLDGETLGDAFLGLDYIVTTSSSTWGHEASPRRFYLTGFLLVDTAKVPLIAKNKGTVVNLTRTELPAKRDTFFGNTISEEFVTGVWEAKGGDENDTLLRLLKRILGKRLDDARVQGSKNHSEQVATAIGNEIIDQTVWRSMAQQYSNPTDSNRSALESGTAHMAARACGQRISELERVYDMHSRINTASIVIVQVDVEALNAAKAKPAEKEQK